VADRSFADRLGRESETWVTEGIVSAEQAAAIRDRYAVAGEEPRGRATVALAVIGAVTVGVGVIGFVAANWDGMSNGVRLALLTATVAGAYAAAYHLRERTGVAPRLGEALYLVGVLCFGASLFLVGQMYNVEAHDPLALLLWAGGAVATALVVRSRAVAVASVLIFTAWIGFEFGVALDGAGGDTFAAFPVVALLYGSALYGLSTGAQERLRDRAIDGLGFPETGRGVGLALGAGGVFVFTFSEATDELVRAGDEIRGFLLGGFALIAVLAFAGAAALALCRRPSGRYEASVLAVAVAAAVFATLGGDDDVWALVFNVVFAAVALGAVYAGYLCEEPWLVNVGVLLVAIDIVARYFDVFWSALPRSLGLIVAGLLVLGIAFVLEGQRKRLLERMRA
jgi:uncharacterized membrane protein